MNIAEYQKDCCANYGVGYEPPGPDQLVLISDGFYDSSLPVSGERAPPNDQLSGWLLTTPKHDGKPESLVCVHFHHVVDKRPDLAIYMALPTGSAFLLNSGQDHVRFPEDMPLPQPA